jgi:hypothetical protein
MSHDTVGEMTPQELGSLLGRSTRKVVGRCLQCAGEMVDVTVRRAFCSARCRQKHWRTRQNGLKPGEPMPYVTDHRNPTPVPEPASGS